MTRIAIITPGRLPVPAVRGGAVEGLVDAICLENEAKHSLEITAFGTTDPEAQLAADAFQHTGFTFVQKAPAAEHVYALTSRALSRGRLEARAPSSPYLRKILGQLRGESYDAIVVENRPGFVLPLSRSTSVPVILHLHNDTLNRSTPAASEIIAACTGIITVSDFLASRIRSVEGADDARLSRLLNCVDDAAFGSADELDKRGRLRQDMGLAESDLVVIYAGRIDPQKGIRELVTAFGLLEARNCHLLVVGSDWYGETQESDFSKELRQLSAILDGRIHFTGFVSPRGMPAMYAMADLAVVPSMWDEPAGLVVIEAMASGLPLIATASGGIPEYCSSTCAILVDRGEDIVRRLAASIDELAGDEGRRRDMGAAGRVLAARFNRSAYYGGFVETVRRFISTT